MTQFPALAFLLFASFLQGSAQEAKVPETTSSVAGTVTGEPGSRPLKKVVVQLVAEDQKQGGNYSVITDADGHFRVENVSPGRYRVFFEKTGFIEVNDRGQKADVNMVTVPAGHSVEDLMFRMLATAVITGRITDEDGDPMSGVRVVAIRRVPGKVKRQSVNAAATDDQGEYRMAGFFPGQYWVAAIPPPDVRDYARTRDRSPADEVQPETRYVTTYYPSTYDGAQASPVALKAGDEMPVNVMLVPSRTYRVRGMLTGMAPGQHSAVELISRMGDSVQGSEVRSDGTFEVHGAAPGSYVLRASTTSDATVLTARQEITIAAANVEGVKLVPMAAFRLSGHLRVESSSSGDPSLYSVNLRQADVPDDAGFFMSEDSFGENAPVDRAGNFEWKNVNPGTFVLQVYGGNGKDNFFLKSATFGGTSIDGAFTAKGPAEVNVVISTNAGSVEGVVTSRDTGKDQGNDTVVANVTIVAVPEEKYRKIPDRFGRGATDQYGHFRIHGLAPGSYTLFAWQDVDESICYDADFLKSQEANGTAVKVEAGSQQSVALKLSSIGEDWR